MSATIPLKEADWQHRVEDAAKLFGWRYAHFRPARTAKGWRTAMQGYAGFPDLVLLRPPRLLLVELKAESGRVSAEQSDWLAQLAEIPGIEVHIWRPSDWPQVINVLSGGRASLTEVSA